MHCIINLENKAVVIFLQHQERIFVKGLTECLATKYLSTVFSQCSSKENAAKDMRSLAIENFSLPGEPGFPLNAMYHKPSGKLEAGDMLG